MPASSEDCLLHIKGTLQSSLSKGSPASSLDQRLVSNSKKILMQKIHFRPAAKASQAYQFETLRAKYTSLNARGSKGPSPEVVEGYRSPESMKMSGESLPAPKVILFPPDKVKLEWPAVKRVGAGLVNLGNTCFLNSTLQCLTYCAPLVNHLMDDHCNKCKQVGFCMLCELQRHINRCYENAGGSIKPHTIVHKLRVIAKHMHLGRQEDAHEFLRYVIDHMQKACLYGCPKLDSYSKETTAVNQIFGGYLRSQVLCLRCKGRSNTYDPFLDISLDIKNVPTVQKALERYVQPERLDSDNAYSCTKCKQKVPAQKKFTVHKAPNVLTVQLKRFDCSRPSAKVTRHIQFSEKLDLRQYMSNRGDSPVTYQLYAVLVHSGFSCNSGHYYCYIRAPNRTWYCMNDQHVSESSLQRVLSAEAYLLFYQRMKAPAPPKGVLIGPKLPAAGMSNCKHDPTSKQQSIGKLSNDVGTPMSRKPLQKSSTVVSGDHKPSSTVTKPPPTAPLPAPRPGPSSIPAASQREKVSFGIKPKEENSKETENGIDGKPRLVIHIKHGKVCYNSVDEKKQEKPHRLVPYNGESDSSDSETNNVNSNKPDQLKINKEVENRGRSGEPVVDDSLSTTTSVPGSYGPLDKAWAANKNNRRSKDDTHNMFNNVHKNKFLRRSFSDDGLTIETSPTKLNSTTRWTIFDGDAQISPSLASGSSNGSINSTTGWHVRHKEKLKGHGLVETQHSGWKVTPKKSAQQQEKPRSPQGSANKTEEISTDTGARKLSVTLKKQTSADSLPDSSDDKIKRTVKTSISDSELSKIKSKKHSMFPFKLSCLSSVSDSPDGKEPLIKGHKPYDLSVYDFDDADEDSNTRVPFHRTKSQNHSDTGEAPRDDEDENQETDHVTKHKKHKKHKKNKKKHKHEHNDLVDNGEAAHKKKKKKKHKKKKYEICEEEAEEAQVMKKKRRCDDVDDKDDEPVNGEYKWVEKRVDNDPEKNTTSRKPVVPVYSWDQAVKDAHKQPVSKGMTDSESKATTTVTPWDGTRKNNDVIGELEKTSAWGYGAQVTSWDGSRSQVDQDLDKERRANHKRRWSDEYEEELDRGKVKKVRQNMENGYNGNHGNMFQRYQDGRNQDKDRRKSGFMSPDRDGRPQDRYRDNRDHEHSSGNRTSHKSGYHGYHERKHYNHHNNHRDSHKSTYYNNHHDRHSK